MPKIAKELTKKEIDAIPKRFLTKDPAKTEAFIAVGGAPYLYYRWVHNPTGAGTKEWVYFYPHPVTKKRQKMGLGSLRNVTLAEARESANIWQRVLNKAEDPKIIRENRAKDALAQSIKHVRFETFASNALDLKTAGLKNAKNKAQHHSTFRDYVYPIIGRMQISEIDTHDVSKIFLQKTSRTDTKQSGTFWEIKHDTARKVRERLEWVFAHWANIAPKTLGYDNPAIFRHNLETQLPRIRRNVAHHESLHYSLAPAMYKVLRKLDTPASKALQLIMMHAGRVSEIGYMTWSELDLEDNSWTVPANRMKNGKDFYEPLTAQAITLLKAEPRESINVWKSGGVSETALRNCHKTTGFDGTRHGFRSTFSDWALDKGRFDNNVVDLCLAHSKPALEAAYQRTDLRTRRRVVMQAWVDYLEGNDE